MKLITLKMIKCLYTCSRLLCNASLITKYLDPGKLHWPVKKSVIKCYPYLITKDEKCQHLVRS